MSRRNKLTKFAEISALSNVFENFNAEGHPLTWCGELRQMAGKWHEHFGNQNPITLELACGKGEYTLGLAQLFPERNFIGVDIKGARIWKGARQAIKLGLQNAAFLRTRIELIMPFFHPDEIDEIWIIFPDPFPRESKANRRLTSPPYLHVYSQLLKRGGIVHLKTDDANLFQYTVRTVEEEPNCTLITKDSDIYANEPVSAELNLKTFYEAQHLAKGKKITYVSFTMD